MAKERAFQAKQLKKPGRYDGYPEIDQFQLYSYLNFIRPIHQEPSGFPILYDLFRFNRSRCLDVPAIVGVRYTYEEEKEIIKQHDDKLNKISDKYDLKEWIRISYNCSISFSDWLRLTVYAKNALIYDFNEFMEDLNKEKGREKMQEELRMKQEMHRNKSSKTGADSARLSIFR